jgi:hypothetical protein
MPDVKPNEKQSEFISRCVKEVMNEGKPQKEALGKCYGIYRQAKKSIIKNIYNKILKQLSSDNGGEALIPQNLAGNKKKNGKNTKDRK